MAAWLFGALGLAAGGYAVSALLTWQRYGHPVRPPEAGPDALLDRFMPAYDVVEHHQVRVDAPAATTLAAAAEQDLMQSPIVRAIFGARALVLGAAGGERPVPRGLLAQVQALGWGILAEEPGREIVVGAVTKPWEANVAFQAVDPEAFARFDEPGYVKIAWTLRADPVGGGSVYQTETRAVATDGDARRRFRTYWAFVMPGTWLIRRLSLGPLRREAERRAADAAAAG